VRFLRFDFLRYGRVYQYVGILKYVRLFEVLTFSVELVEEIINFSKEKGFPGKFFPIYWTYL
jgi:hypothetical protein